MHIRPTPLAACLLGVLAAAALPVHAGEEENVMRLREMLHRTQEALHQAQSDNADLSRAQAAAEQKLAAVTQSLEAARGVSKAELALRGQLKTSQAAQDDLTHKLGEASERLAATNTKLDEATQRLAAREAELLQVKQGLEQSKAANASCEDKNLKLYSYSQELLGAYRKKGVWAALAQKDPVLGLKEVGVENVVQEYRLKFASEQIKPQQAKP
jgi:DNA repair exonuclease SbcCD ATPase subunit